MENIVIKLFCLTTFALIDGGLVSAADVKAAVSAKPAPVSATPAKAAEAKPAAVSGTPAATPLKPAAASATQAASPVKPTVASSTVSSAAMKSAAVSSTVSASAMKPSGISSAVKAEPAPAPPPAARSRFVPLADADIRGGYTTVRHGKGAWGLTGNVLLLPAYQLTDRGVIIPIYAFSGALADRVVEESILFTQRQIHMLSLGYKQGFADDFDFKLSSEATYALTQETKDEKMGRGLYDYRDFGGREVITWKHKRDGRDEPVQSSIKIYRRSYPFFLSLADENKQFLASVNPTASRTIGDKEKRPKDFLGTDFELSGVRWLARELRGKLEYNLSLRSYEDRYLRNNQGAISDNKRLDTVHRMEAKFDWLGLRSFPMWTSLEGMFFGSSGNYYDPAQEKHGYIPRFYQFIMTTWRTRMTWDLPFGEKLHPSVYAGTGIGLQSYTDRVVQDQYGVNGDDTQLDQIYSLDLGGNYPIFKWLGVVAGVSGSVVRSNNKYEQYIKYSYELLTASLGVTLRY